GWSRLLARHKTAPAGTGSAGGISSFSSFLRQSCSGEAYSSPPRVEGAINPLRSEGLIGVVAVKRLFGELRVPLFVQFFLAAIGPRRRRKDFAQRHAKPVRELGARSVEALRGRGIDVAGHARTAPHALDAPAVH